MIILIVVGALAMFVSTQQDRIWWILVWFMVGMTCLSLLLLQISDTLEVRLRTDPFRWWPWAFGGMAAAGLVFVALSIDRQWSPIIAIGGMVVLTLGLVGVFLWFSRPADADADPDNDDDEPSIGVGSAAWYGFEAMAVGIGLFLISDGTATLIGAIAWLVGLVIVKIGAKPWLESRGDDLRRTVRILVDVTLAGLFILFAGAFGSVWVLVLLGLSVVTAALSMVGVGALQLPCSSKRASWAMGLALAGMSVVWGWMWVVTQNPGLAFVMGLMIALAGGFFVLRGEGIVLLMLAGFVVAWGLVDRTVTLAEAAPVTDGAPVRIVALGDSFISGEGAPEFFAGTNDAGGNQCRRAPTAHPYLMAAALETNVVSVACSGAKIADLISCGQMWPDGRRCRVEPAAEAPTGGTDSDVPTEPDAVPNALEGVWMDALQIDDDRPPGRLPQLVTAIDRNLNEAADVVLLSIGGNDVGFSSIVKACLLPKGCDERREVWLGGIDLLGPKLDKAYNTIAATFPSAKVMVMPYPMLVNAEQDTSCDLGLSQDEREFMVDFIEKLDVTISEAAARAGFEYVADAVNAYDDFQLCDDEAAANHLKLVPPEGDKLGRYSPGTWIPGSMHPNSLGHELTAQKTVCTLAEQLEISSASGTIAGSREFECSPSAEATAGASGDSGEGTGAGDGVVVDETSEACEAALTAGGAPTVREAAACAAVSQAVDEQIEQQIEELAAEVAVVTEELVSDDEWIRVELFRTVRALALPLLLLLALGMVFAWGFAQLDNPLSRFLRQEQQRPDR